MTRLIDADGLKNKFYHGDLVPNKEMYHISEIMYAINNAPTVDERQQGEQKDIDIPKMCEECHSQSYNNGFDAGYELGKKDAQKHITEFNERIEFLMQQIRLWQSWASTEQQGKDSEENMNEQETFGECKNCKYRDCDITEMPCKECYRGYINLYEEADNETN